MRLPGSISSASSVHTAACAKTDAALDVAMDVLIEDIVTVVTLLLARHTHYDSVLSAVTVFAGKGF